MVSALIVASTAFRSISGSLRSSNGHHPANAQVEPGTIFMWIKSQCLFKRSCRLSQTTAAFSVATFIGTSPSAFLFFLFHNPRLNLNHRNARQEWTRESLGISKARRSKSSSASDTCDHSIIASPLEKALPRS